MGLKFSIVHTLAAALAAGAGASAMASCTILYDGDDFMSAADPCKEQDIDEFVLRDIEPKEVLEGQGCLLDGASCSDAGRAVPIVIHGCQIARDAKVTLASQSGDVTLVPLATQVSDNGQVLAFTVAVPVDDTRGAGMTSTIDVTVSQGGDALTQSFTTRWLDELDTATTPALDADALAGKLFSRITIGAPATITGSVVARLVATSEIAVNSTLSANAVEEPGPGGSAGGLSDRPGDGLGAGKAGEPASADLLGNVFSGGGGGGGHGVAGKMGDGGSSGGDPGVLVGEDVLVPLQGGSGGGAGGRAEKSTVTLTVISDGGTGGAGGGAIELTSLGRLTLGPGAIVDVRGGTGKAAEVKNNVGVVCGGSGGGGAGGAIVVRAAQSFDASQAAASWVDVSGGSSESSSNDDCFSGGAGGAGRVRVDIPGPDTGLPRPPAQGTFFRGPVIAPALPVIVSKSPVEIEVFGRVGTSYALQSQGGSAIPFEGLGDRAVSVSLTLEPGLDEICVLASTKPDTGSTSEGRNCLTIAYVPGS